MGRASGLFRMCAEADVEYTHVSTRPEIGAALWGAESTNLLPPMIQDGDLVLSQAVPCHQYLGDKFGFNKNIEIPQVAVQYVNDLSDFYGAMESAALKGEGSNDVHALQEYLNGDRFKNHLRAINRSIKGKFYFGEDPTYVDYAVCTYLDMAEGRYLNPLKSKINGDIIAEYAPKMRAICTAIRELPSAKKFENTQLVADFLALSEERVSTWKT